MTRGEGEVFDFVDCFALELPQGWDAETISLEEGQQRFRLRGPGIRIDVQRDVPSDDVERMIAEWATFPALARAYLSKAGLDVPEDIESDAGPTTVGHEYSWWEEGATDGRIRLARVDYWPGSIVMMDAICDPTASTECDEVRAVFESLQPLS